MEEIKKLVLDESEKGFIVISTFDGLKKAKLSEIIEQPTPGLLYDLNRDEATILTFINDPKWVNDYACMKVISYLKNKLEEKIKTVPYQMCPICNGTGKTIADGFTSSVYQVCKCCNGSTIIPMCVVS